MASRRLDYKVWTENGYHEHASMRGVEMKTVEDVDCLVQEFFGELKTNRGEVYGIGMSQYGSDLKRNLGENIDFDALLEIENDIGRTIEEYPEILDFKLGEFTEESDGLIHIEIEIHTIYGIVLRILDISRGC